MPYPRPQHLLLLLFIGASLHNVHVGAFVPTSSQVVYQPSPTKPTYSNYKILTNVERGGSMKAEPVAEGFSLDSVIDAPRIAITIACTFLTWYAQKQYTNVMASSALTLICSMCFDKRLGQAAFCGTFAGMASTKMVPTWQYAVGLGTLTSFFYEILIEKKNCFVGVGGRLGATAFIASLIIAAIQGLPTGLSLASLTIDNLQKNVILSMALWHAVGSAATIVLRSTSDDTRATDTVRASATIGLIAALLLEDKTAALAVYGGSFVGMSAPTRLLHGILPSQVKDGAKVPDTSASALLISFAIAGALGGIVHGASIGLNWFNGGWGGKAGFCGFVGCLLYRALRIVKGKLA